MTSIVVRNMPKPKRYFFNNFQDVNDDKSEEDSTDFFTNKIAEVTDAVLTNQKTRLKDGDGGPYVGVAGPAYMCYHLSKFENDATRKDELLDYALKFTEVALSYINHPQVLRNRTQECAFLLGSGGVMVVAILVYNARGMMAQRDELIKRYISAAQICKPVSFLNCGGDELLVGRAGYLCGCLLLNRLIGSDTVPNVVILDICKLIIKSGQEYTKKNSSPSPLMYSYYDTEYLGSGHGLAGILQMLLAVPECLDEDPQAESDVKASVDFMLSLQTTAGNFPTALDELGDYTRPEEDQLVHWCHGAPGVVYMLARAYLRWKEPQYLDSCRKCADIVWQKGLLKKGPGICHGVSGSGYVFLLLYKLTGEPMYLHRARKFAEFMSCPEFKEARTPDCLYSLYEGLAGTACFLTDLLNPDSSQFPLFDDIGIDEALTVRPETASENTMDEN